MYRDGGIARQTALANLRLRLHRMLFTMISHIRQAEGLIAGMRVQHDLHGSSVDRETEFCIMSPESRRGDERRKHDETSGSLNNFCICSRFGKSVDSPLSSGI
jgi:hypothetical protein